MIIIVKINQSGTHVSFMYVEKFAGIANKGLES
jgi:hypothetical protein